MYTKTLFRSALLGLMALGLWGCQAADRAVGPEIGAASLSTATDALQVVKDNTTSIASYTAIIGKNGGKMVLGNTTLVIPAGAVSAPTTFEMIKLKGLFEVALTATQLTLNDIGSAGFAVPLTLSFDYTSAAEPADPSSYVVVWIRSDGVMETQPTTLDESAGKVHGSISHFSDYAMATN